MKSILLALSVITLSTATVCHASTTVFSWVDVDGVIHFSDKKPVKTPASTDSLKSIEIKGVKTATEILENDLLSDNAPQTHKEVIVYDVNTSTSTLKSEDEVETAQSTLQTLDADAYAEYIESVRPAVLEVQTSVASELKKQMAGQATLN